MEGSKNESSFLELVTVGFLHKSGLLRLTQVIFGKVTENKETVSSFVGKESSCPGGN